MTTLPPPIARSFPAPITANSVDWPRVSYGGRVTAINFPLDNDEDDNPNWGRVTFEKFDSLRVSRGEYMPYETAWKSGDPHSWIWTVSDSPWLLERYTYEKEHYGTSYGFGGDVDEMIRDFSHYVFRFHDQFVEVLCDGIWFETSQLCLDDREPGPDHPSRNLPESTIIDRFTAHGITCHVRKNPRALHDLFADAAYASQKLYQFAAELGGDTRPSWTLSLRVRKGKPTIQLEGFFGKTVQRYESIPDLATLRPHIDSWLAEVSAHHQQKRPSKPKD